MCGICGFIGEGNMVDLTNMNNSMLHRGPDDSGIWYDVEKSVYLGHRRLSIIDLLDGHQPMWTRDKNIGIVFNGEIYNFNELREVLINRGHVFSTSHSDTEVLLYGYLEWGQDLPNKLNGMWAFALLDLRENIVFCSRDRFGKKPLYYTLQNNTFAFASELSSLIKHSNIKHNISTRSLKKYFAYGYIPAPSSLYEQIYKLPAGHNLTLSIKDLSCKVFQYWDFILEPTDDIPKNAEKLWGETLTDLLDKSVRRRLISDVPLGVFLSGGVDSSCITALATKIVGQNNLQTFSIGFTENSFDESQYANMVSKLFGTIHYNEIFSIDTLKSYVNEVIDRLDEPMGDSSILPTYLLCKTAKQKVTVALSGDGGDELFAGYDPFKALKSAELYAQIVPKPIHIAIRLLANSLPTSFNNISIDFKIKRTLRGLSYPKNLWNTIWLGPLEPKEITQLFEEPLDIEDTYSEAINYWEKCRQKDIISRTMQFYTKLYLQDGILVKSDRASMFNSLEVRSPFLDIELVDFIRKIPYEYKYKNGETKYLLKKSLEHILPNEILYRPKKGFGAPIARWLSDNSINLKNNSNLNSLVKSDYVNNLYRQHMLNKSDNRLFLWNLIVLERFFQ